MLPAPPRILMMPSKSFRTDRFLLLAAALAVGPLGAQESLPVDRAPEPIATWQGVEIRNGGYGSGMARHPAEEGVYYLMTDRGPDVDGAEPGTRIFPVPGFTPRIGVFREREGRLVRDRVILIRDGNGDPVTGLPNPAGVGGTGETALDPEGRILPPDEVGLDPEGLVALPDGGFWVSDEYGPHVLHLDATGRTLERINPFGNGLGGRSLPRVFAHRRPDRGMEGLTITPDGSTLVGIMQSPLDNPPEDRSTIRESSRATRILLFDIESGHTRQYLYFQEAPALSNSEIRALSDTEFIVLERDGLFAGNPDRPAVHKRFHRISIEDATDISDPGDGESGLTFGGRTLEQMSLLEILDAGIVPVRKELHLDLLEELPGAYGHDKPEGFSIREDGSLEVVNDDDFGILGDGAGGIMAKTLPPDGNVDANVLYRVIPSRRAPEGFRLQLLHSANLESRLQDPDTLEPRVLNYDAVVRGLRELARREEVASLFVSAGDQTIQGPFYEAAVEVEDLGAGGLGDIALHNAMGMAAVGIGDHEFTRGIDDFARILEAARYPFLAANLDFSGVILSEGSPAIRRGTDGGSAEENAGKVAGSAWIEVGGERIGLVGHAPDDLFNEALEPDRLLPGLDFIGGRHPGTNLPSGSSLELVQEQVDLLTSMGIDKIILLEHPLDRGVRSLPVDELRDVDIIVFAKTPDILARSVSMGPFNLLRPGEIPTEEYPRMENDAVGHPVVLVSGGLGYRHVGHLMVTFDEEGRISEVDGRSGPVSTHPEAVAALSTELVVPTLKPSEGVESVYRALTGTPYMQSLYAEVATTATVLNGEEEDVRRRDTNLGQLVADAYLWWGRRQEIGPGEDVPVDISLKNGGGILQSILGPRITRLGIRSTLVFDNRMTLLEVTGAELLAAMENALALHPEPDGSYPHVAGIEVEYDPRRAGVIGLPSMRSPSRVSRLVVDRENGERVVLIDDFRVVGDLSRTFGLMTHAYLATGGSGFVSLDRARTNPDRSTWETDIGERSVLEEYLSEGLDGHVDRPDDTIEPRTRIFNELGEHATWDSGIFDENAAGIVDYDPFTRRLYVSNAHSNGIDVLDLRDPSRPHHLLSYTGLGGNVNSVAVSNKILAVAVENEDPLRNGYVVFLDVLLGIELNRLEVGVLPDMVTFTPDGSRVLTANEGEPNDDYTVDPPGSVSIIEVGSGSVLDIMRLTQADVTTLDFSAYNFLRDVLRDLGVRIFGEIRHPRTGEYLRDSTVAEDLEPEYITVGPDGTRAYVALQENNAMAVIDLERLRWVDLIPLGTKDHSVEGQGMDASDRDNAVNIRTWPVSGMYQPAAIHAYRSLGRTWIVTANEGDARDYDGYSEEVRVGDLTLDPVAYPDAGELQADENLGRLVTTTATGDLDGDGDVDRIHSYGARSFSIRDASGLLIYDSGDDFERLTADLLGEGFNSNDDSQDSFDSRSDAKGPEPEGLAIGRIGERIYAFIGLERPGGIMMYDITAPHSARFVRYINLRDFGAEDAEDAGDLAPEGLKFIPAGESASGRPLLVVANEVSGTTTVHVVRVPVPRHFTLQLLHTSDNESSLRDPNTLENHLVNYVSVLDGLRHLAARENIPSLYLAAGDLVLPGPFFQASSEFLGSEGIADMEFFNHTGLVANGMGHHELDRGIDIFARMLAAADFPFLASNLDFSQVVLAEGTPPVRIGRDAASVEENAGKVARSSWVEIGGERIGLIGAVPDIYFDIINDPGTFLPGLDFVGGRDPDTNRPLRQVIESIHEQVDLLEAQGIDKIILLDNAQNFLARPSLAENLRGVDIVVAAGEGELMAGEEPLGPFNLLRPEDEIVSVYPQWVEDSEGREVLVVNGNREYRYVGHLLVTFDDRGHILSHDRRSGLVATTEESIGLLQEELAGRIGTPVLGPSPEILSLQDQLESTDLILDQFTVLGTTAHPLVGDRDALRTRDTNLGNLAADATLRHAQTYLDEETDSGLRIDFVIMNSGGIGESIIGPSITRMGVSTAFRYDNPVSIAEMDVGELLATFENAVSFYPRIFDGRYPQTAGVYVEFDSSRPAIRAATFLEEPSRIRTLVVHRADGTRDVVVSDHRVQGDRDRTFVFGTNTFQMTGGDGYLAMKVVNDDPERPVYVTELGQRGIFEEYLEEVFGGAIDLADPPPRPRVVHVGFLGRLLSARISGTSVDYLFGWAPGRTPLVEATTDLVGGRWTVLEEGSDYRSESIEDDLGRTSLSVIVPLEGAERFIRLGVR